MQLAKENARSSAKNQADHQTERLVKRTMRAMLTAVVLLFFLNASALQRYIADLPSTPVTEELLLLSEDWTAITKQIGAAKPLETLREKMLEITEEIF